MAFAAAAIGGIVSGIASLAAASAQSSALEEQADAEEKISRYNADRKREEASYAQAKGAQESEQKEKEGRRQAAIARAARAQGGIATDSGTSLLLESEFAAETEYSVDVAMANAQREQRDFENSAKITEYEGTVRANASRAKAGAARLSGFAGAVKGIGGGIAKAFG